MNGDSVAGSMASSPASSPSDRGELLPQREHDQILRMREPQRLEHRSVHGDHVAGGRHHGEAELILELEQVVDPHEDAIASNS